MRVSVRGRTAPGSGCLAGAWEVRCPGNGRTNPLKHCGSGMTGLDGAASLGPQTARIRIKSVYCSLSQRAQSPGAQAILPHCIGLGPSPFAGVRPPVSGARRGIARAPGFVLVGSRARHQRFGGGAEIAEQMQRREHAIGNNGPCDIVDRLGWRQTMMANRISRSSRACRARR